MANQADLRQTLLQRAQELFALCDYSGKGFAYKDEIGALGTELPLSPEQLEDVFDSLDADGDGKLTLQEFTDGFGMFLGIDSHPRGVYNGGRDEDDDEDEILEELLDHLGAKDLFTDEDYVREMWHRVRKDDPVMRSNFENFISNMAADLKQTAAEKETLESALKSREQENESRVQSLYAEMEEQLQREKEEALAREHRKEQQLRDELETELNVKDQQLHELLQRHAQMEKQLKELNSEEAETKYENQKLQKDRDILESRLAASEKMLHSMKDHLGLLRKRSIEEKRKRAQAALKVSEGIALERENLVLELQQLKELNKQLLDEKDELVQTAVQLIPARRSIERTKSSKAKLDLIKEESLENVMPSHAFTGTVNGPVLKHGVATENHPLSIASETQEWRENNIGPLVLENHPLSIALETQECLNSPEFESEIPPPEFPKLMKYEKEEKVREDFICNNLNIPMTKRRNRSRQNTHRLSIETNSSDENTSNSEKVSVKEITTDEFSTPSRVFKVVFLGDSGVGKTSILQRFCTNNFKSTFNATVGIDFQMKTIAVDGERIALQLWDTAGQERFRSLTQQYFRKADGIIIVYDVTVETTFKNVRNWMYLIQEGIQNNSAMLLIGNKIDLCESDDDRVVRTKDGERMADEFGAIFYETSAKTGNSVAESISGLASVLKSKEDESIEHVLKLEEEIKLKRKKRCCI